MLGYTAPRANSGSFFLTANTETTYGSMFLDLRANGPTVIENPPDSLCVLDDFWFRYVADLGLAGPDQGAGGKYLILPPSYDGDEPGKFTYRSPTFTNWLVVRALGGVEDIVKTRVYPLAQAGDPPQMTYLNIAAKTQNTVHANDFSFYEEINTLIQEEPAEALDPERAGQCAAIGIVKGQPFEPDDRMRRILSQAAPLAAAAARAITYKPRNPAAYLYPGSAWLSAFIGGSYEFLRNHARLLDARAQFHYVATVITPAMAAATVGTGSAYAYTAMDANGDWLDGGQTYRLTLPAGIPAKNFWSVDLYDTQTRSLLETDNPYPSVMSLGGTVRANDDGSTSLYFGPAAPEGKQSNWVQTVPASPGSPCCGSTGRSHPGSTRGGPARSNRSAVRSWVRDIVAGRRAGRAGVCAARAGAVRRAPAQDTGHPASGRGAADLRDRGGLRGRRAGSRLDAERAQGADLRRDPRFALHSATVDPVGAPKRSGRARPRSPGG